MRSINATKTKYDFLSFKLYSLYLFYLHASNQIRKNIHFDYEIDNCIPSVRHLNIKHTT